MSWLSEFKISDVFSGVWDDIKGVGSAIGNYFDSYYGKVKDVFTKPEWTEEFSFNDFWTGVKDDAVTGAKAVGETAKGLLKGIRGVLTPTVIWIFAIAIGALIIFRFFKKTVKI